MRQQLPATGSSCSSWVLRACVHPLPVFLPLPSSSQHLHTLQTPSPPPPHRAAVFFKDLTGLEDAIRDMHDKELEGRKISVVRAVPQDQTKPGTPAAALGGGGRRGGYDRGGPREYNRGSYYDRPYDRGGYDRGGGGGGYYADPRYAGYDSRGYDRGYGGGGGAMAGGRMSGAGTTTVTRTPGTHTPGTRGTTTAATARAGRTVEATARRRAAHPMVRGGCRTAGRPGDDGAGL